MQRALFDMKAPEGREAFLQLAEHRRRDHRELPARRGRPASASATRRCPPATRASCTARPAGSARAARTRSGRRTTSTTWGSAGSSTAPAARADGGPPIPGATVADSAGGGMHAVMAILAALVRRATTGERRLPRRVRGRRRARAHGARRSTSTSPPARSPRRGHGLLTGRYACYDSYPTPRRQVGHASPPSSRGSGRTSAARSVSTQWAAHQTDDAVQDEIRADLRAVFLTPRPRRLGRRPHPRRHLRGTRC